MNYEFHNIDNKSKNRNIILKEVKIPSSNNELIKNNYFISDVKIISPHFKVNNNKSENLNVVYHNINFRGRNIKNEEIKNHDSYNQYLSSIDKKWKNNNNIYHLINHSPQNMHYNKNNILKNENQKLQHNISPIKINLFSNNKPFNSENKSNRNNFYDSKNNGIINKIFVKDFNKSYFDNDDNNKIPIIPKNDTCIENFENFIIKKNQINIIPIPKKLSLLNNDIRKNLFCENKNQNFSGGLSNYFSPPKKKFKNIDINLDYSYSNEDNFETNLHKFNKTSIKLSPKSKQKFNNINIKKKLNNEKENSKEDFSRQLNIRIKKLKNISNDDFKITWNGKSKAGRDKNRNIKINQDAFRVCENVNNIKNFNFYILCDGHGKDGHYVSKYITQNIISNISFHPSLFKKHDTEEIYQIIIKNNYQLIKDIFSQIDNCLFFQKEFDTIKSGCTCVLIIQIGLKIICANVGDSRAILVYSNSPNLNNTKIFPLSSESKPNLPSELIRIINCGGEVHKKINNKGEYVGPMRVYAKGKDYPGLAMSRSFGDFECKKYGVINEPSFVEYCLDENCKYLVIGSDGVWDFLDNENVVKTGNKYYLGKNPEGFCNEILEKAKYWWEKEDNVIDDITALVVFFDFFV